MQNSFVGTFFSYSDQEFKAFKSNNDSNTIICYLEGLGGNLLSDSLSQFLYGYSQKHNYTFLQPVFRSHPNFGIFTLNEDIEELNCLLNLFAGKKIILIGSSTGCQDIVYFLRNCKTDVAQAFLVAPVSDREYEEKNTALKQFLEKVENFDDNFVFVYNGSLFCKERFLDLYKTNGKDDLFSSNLSDHHFQTLNTQNCQLNFIMCGNDKYVVISNESKLKLVPNAKIYKIEQAEHCLSTESDFMEFEKILDQTLTK